MTDRPSADASARPAALEPLRLLVNIDVDDLAAAERFYRAALALRPARRFGDDAVELVGASSTIYLLAKAAGSVACPGTIARRGYARHWTPVHLDVVVDDLEDAVARSLAAGAVQEQPIRDAAWGRMALMADPFGHGYCLLAFSGAGYDAVATGSPHATARADDDAPAPDAPAVSPASVRDPASAPSGRLASCTCGQLGARVRGAPLRVSICHCLACQRRSGSAFAYQARFPAAAVDIDGDSTAFVRVGDEGGRATFHFCACCGDTVFYRPEASPDIVAIPVGAFADPAFPAPEVSVYGSRRHAWVGLPAHIATAD